MIQTIQKLGKLLFSIFCFSLSLSAYAGGGPGGGGGGGGGSSLTCNTPVSRTMPNNTTAQNPTITNCLNGPGYYSNSDVDGDGCEDVQYSVENNEFFTFTAPAGSGCQTYTANLVPSGDLNLQGSWFPPISGTNSCSGSCSGYDTGGADHHDSGVNGTGNSFSLSMTLCAGETATIMTDGYAGDTDGSYTLEVVCPILLNLELVDLRAYYQDAKVYLSWITASEQVGDVYVIERSKNAIDFEVIGRLNGSGASVNRKEYAWTDESPLQGFSYYRVRQKAADGGEMLSTIAVVETETKVTKFTVAPNPASNQLTIFFNNPTQQKSYIKILSVLGKLVHQETIGREEMQCNIDVSKLPKGMYLLVVGNKLGTRTEKVLITN